jgi:hypothetical protein
MLFLSAAGWAADAGLITSLSGRVLLQEERAATELKPFVRVQTGDRLTLEGASHLHVVYLDSGREEVWQGAGQLEIGSGASRVIKGSLRPDARMLPPPVVRQIAKTPSADGSTRSEKGRMRSMPTVGTLESLERHYAELRRQAEADDRNPELYLLAGYFELREFERVEALLKRMSEKAPGDMEVRVLRNLYARAINNAKTAVK